ncbi:MAG: hypothetical protein HC890_10980 [Chloroflexaceae bacterium]|nr:hypothetical protein [Chloroflexaceae bacterium]
MVCLRHRADIDNPCPELPWSEHIVQQLLTNNPDLWVYQMHDPNQDRLKVGRVAYFRLKQACLTPSYSQFLQHHLAPGGTIFLLECNYSWLSTKISDRHIFQFGGKGGLEPQEYLEPSAQISQFLQDRGSLHQQWHPPAADGSWPESEWGFEPALREEVERLARHRGFRLRRLIFDEPQALSAWVASLYRWWYRQQGLPDNRLLVESFVYLNPWWVLRLGLVPYWAVFNDLASLAFLNHYLDSTQPYSEIYANLFSNGLNSLGIATIEQWQAVLERSPHSKFIGVNTHKYPADLASAVRHYSDLKKLKPRYPLPNPLSLEALDTFIAENPQPKVHFVD